MTIFLTAAAFALGAALLVLGVGYLLTRKASPISTDDARVGDRVRALALDLMFLPEMSAEYDSSVEGVVIEVTAHELLVRDRDDFLVRCLRPGAVVLERAPEPPPAPRKLTIVVAKLGDHNFESRVRDGIGAGSHEIPGIPVCTGATADRAVKAATAYLEHWEGPVEVVVREDPALTDE